MAEEGKSGKRVVAVLLGLVLVAPVIAWVGATRLEKGTRAGQPGGVTSQPVLSVNEDFVEVQIAGTPWMTLHRSTGEPVE